MFPELSEQEHGPLNMNLHTPEPHYSDSDTSPEKTLPKGDGGLILLRLNQHGFYLG